MLAKRRYLHDLKFVLVLGLFLGGGSVQAQINIKAQAYFSPATHTISVKQSVQYVNTSADTLHQFYFNDWLNAFKSRVSPLGKHFSSTYVKQFRFSELAERGQTRINFIQRKSGQQLNLHRSKAHPDVIAIPLKKALLPGDTAHFKLSYTLRIPIEAFTGYGRDKRRNYNLRYWLISPAVYQGEWQVYSNKDLGDLFSPKTNVELVLRLPINYTVYSAFQQEKLVSKSPYYKRIKLWGKNRTNFKVALIRKDGFKTYHTEYATVVTNIGSKNVPKDIKMVTIERILGFLDQRLGHYPFKKLLVTQADYKNSPLYGLNQLPGFIRPFPDGFQYDLTLMKTLTNAYLKSSLLLNPRQDYWVVNAIAIDLLMDYVNKFYPDTKLIGKLSELIGIRWTHLADLELNYQYQFFFMNMNRLNLDQPLTMSKDSLIKFNQKIANPYKAGVGLKYLEAYLGKEAVRKSIKTFYQKYKLVQEVHPEDFAKILKAKTPKPIDWFFEEYVQTNVRLDFTIKAVEEKNDSLKITIKNKEKNSMPVSLYGLHDKTIVSKYWIDSTRGLSTITIPKKNITRLALNYEGVIPEINKRNNYKNLRGLLNKPLKFRLIKDVENPFYTQFFIMPEFSYNLYDGFIIGPSISNQAILSKRFKYDITPQYAFKSQTLVGGLSASYTHQYRNRNLSDITFGVSGNRFSYAPNSFYYRLSPYVVFEWRHRDLRNRERQYLSLRHVNVYREESPFVNFAEQPNYSVFDMQYTYSDRDLISSVAATIDYQLAEKFSKVSLTAEYRKLFLSNQQIEFRLFAGFFLFNHTNPNSNYFSFALDRPTDYLFDYNYYGRSESSGLFSQQFIESEGGFKSKLEPAFANRWLVTLNSSISFYRDILYVYGDVGMIKNYGKSAKVRFDSGIRVSLIQDYFELFFPVYSSLGWEVGQPHYNQKIRFIVTLDFNTLLGLFERSYY